MRFVSISYSRSHKTSSNYFVSDCLSYCTVTHPIQVANAKKVHLVLNAKLPVLKCRAKKNLSIPALLFKLNTNPPLATCLVLILSKFQSFLAAHVFQSVHYWSSSLDSCQLVYISESTIFRGEFIATTRKGGIISFSSHFFVPLPCILTMFYHLVEDPDLFCNTVVS